MPPPKAAQQRLCDRVRRHAQRHRILPTGYQIADLGRAAQNESQGAGPEFPGEPACRGGNLARPVGELHRVGDVHDQRMIVGAALGGENFPDRFRVGSVGAEPVHGLGRKRDQPAGAQHGNGVFNFPVGNHSLFITAKTPRNATGQ